MVSCEHAEAANTLIEVEDHVPIGDRRLDDLRARLGADLYRLMPVGGYAVPLDAGAQVAAGREASSATAGRAAARG